MQRSTTSPEGPPPPTQGSESSRLFENMVTNYLKTNPSITGAKHQTRQVPELEVRFGTGNNALSRPIRKTEYENTVKTLYASGFRPENENSTGYNILRILPEYYERNTNQHKISNIRAEIAGLDLIQEYCRTNNLNKLLEIPSTTDAVADKIKFTQKLSARVEGNAGDYIKPVEFPDFGFRVSYQNETYYSPRAEVARKIISDWTNSKKIFRYLNRVRFVHPDLPIYADISIVKSSRTTNFGKPVPQYTIQDSGVLTNPEKYEIELEIDNQRMAGLTTPVLVGMLRKTIRMILGAIQETKYPIGFMEMRQVMKNYLTLIHSDDTVETVGKRSTDESRGEEGIVRNVGPDANRSDMTSEAIDKLISRRDLNVLLPKFFIGPSSTTLQTENIVPLEIAAVSNMANIRHNYTVTDKADGERRLLYVAPTGRVYMITPNMNIIFTGTMITKNPALTEGKDEDLYNTLLDGEFISLDKHGDVLNLYMSFDIYFVKGINVRKDGFYPITLEQRTSGKFRFIYLEKYMQAMKLRSIVDSTGDSEKTASSNSNAISSKDRACGLEIQKKNFYVAPEGDQIFEACNSILTNVASGMYPYNTDGLIFTPALTGVNSDRIGVSGKPRKETWEQSFKWKPPEFNTIDFLVSVKKDKRGQDEIQYMYAEGRNIQDDSQNLVQYKTLILRCGYDPARHGYLNPCSDVLHDRISRGLDQGMDPDKSESYRPVPFMPTNPHDPNASFCNIMLRDTGDGDKGAILTTEEGEYFEENMIVEFRYDTGREGAWKWVPIRVRYDKTAELRAGQKNYGNAYHTANSNWHSIHNPVTKEMITTGEDIPNEPHTQNEVYYNRKSRDSNTQGLRNFHNLYVKRRLIQGVASPGSKMLDMACGKGGDLSKWRMGQLKFVVGLDISRDNITNQMDGACSRYLGDCKKYGENMPRCLFFTGDSGKNIRNTGDAFANNKDRDYMKAIFGQGPKDPNELPPGIFKVYGWGEDGFDITSIQFAIHYLFSDEITLHNFLRNVSDCTHVGGYFIGTTYDGETVFQKLRTKQKGDSWTVMRNENKIAEITKKYTDDEFPDDETSIGMQIDVYQDSINKVFPEFLVNFKYLVQLMDQYGFALVTNEQAVKMKLPAGSAMFETLYKTMQTELRGKYINKEEYNDAADMSTEEQQISFLNRYFVFKKTHTVNTENLYKIIRNRSTIRISEKQEEEGSVEGEGSKTTIIKSKKLKQKIVIENCEVTPEPPKEKEMEVVSKPKEFILRVKRPPVPMSSAGVARPGHSNPGLPGEARPSWSTVPK